MLDVLTRALTLQLTRSLIGPSWDASITGILDATEVTDIAALVAAANFTGTLDANEAIDVLAIVASVDWLSSPLGVKITDTTAAISVVTTEGTGTAYWYVSASATPPSVSDHKDGTGSLDFGSIAVTGVDTYTAGPTGLTAGAGTYVHWIQTDDEANDTAQVTSPLWTQYAANNPMLDFSAVENSQHAPLMAA